MSGGIGRQVIGQASDGNSGAERERAAERRAGAHALIAYVVATGAFLVVNALSISTERARAGLDKPALEPWLLEGSSAVILALLFPLVWAWERRAPLDATPWPAAAAAHAIGAVVYSAVHVVLMAGVRAAAWPVLFDAQYNLFSGNALGVFVYEFRKDALSYGFALFLIQMFRSLERARMDAAAAREEARDRGRITLKCGGRVYHLDADRFIAARAAGNYVEARFGERDHLARMTLAALERLLAEAGVDVARVHRSWLVNRAAIAETAPSGEGDLAITMSNGDRVPGSRRYRDRLQPG